MKFSNKNEKERKRKKERYRIKAENDNSEISYENKTREDGVILAAQKSTCKAG